MEDSSVFVDGDSTSEAKTQIEARVLVLPISVLSSLWVVASMHGSSIFYGLPVSIHG